jgi:iron complex outermembrane receptor protein
VRALLRYTRRSASTIIACATCRTDYFIALNYSSSAAAGSHGRMGAGMNSRRALAPSVPTRFALSVVAAALMALRATDAAAQRAGEDAVAQAADAFGSAVGREAIGLYSAGSARGFSPIAAGNLRIDGLYFDQGGNFYPLSTRVVRTTVVGVGIAAQRYLFAAPTGIVDYQLRTPGDTSIASVLIGDASYGEAYEETDVEVPIIRNVLSMGAGIGYTHNVAYNLSARSSELTTGWIAKWQPTPSIEIVPFFDRTDHRQHGQRPHIYIDSDGYPRFYSVTPALLPWAHWDSVSSDFGSTARVSFSGWRLAVGLFRAVQHLPVDYLPFLFDTNRRGQGDYSLNVTPPESSGATSGEVLLSKPFGTARLHHIVYLRITGRSSSIESATGETAGFGPATILQVPAGVVPLNPGPVGNVVTVRQLTPGAAYTGTWDNRVRLTLGLQKVFYHREQSALSSATQSAREQPWLISSAATVFLTPTLLTYGSYTQGFEEIPPAPDTAVNRNAPVPAQLTSQVDAGLSYRLHNRLQLLGGVFEIRKPYFNVDQRGIYRELGDLRNRGVELSLTGDLTEQLHVVTGIALIQAQVRYRSGSDISNAGMSATAVGTMPGYMSTNLEYRSGLIPGLILGATVNVTSSRYARWPDVNLPPFATLGADARYETHLGGHAATFWLRGYNLTDTYGLSPDPNGRLFALDARRYELSFEVDL